MNNLILAVVIVLSLAVFIVVSIYNADVVDMHTVAQGLTLLSPEG